MTHISERPYSIFFQLARKDFKKIALLHTTPTPTPTTTPLTINDKHKLICSVYQNILQMMEKFLE